jgi:hypothetical protein
MVRVVCQTAMDAIQVGFAHWPTAETITASCIDLVDANYVFDIYPDDWSKDVFKRYFRFRSPWYRRLLGSRCPKEHKTREGI